MRKSQVSGEERSGQTTQTARLSLQSTSSFAGYLGNCILSSASWGTFLKSNFSQPEVVDVPALWRFGNYSLPWLRVSKIVAEPESYEMSLSDRL